MICICAPAGNECQGIRIPLHVRNMMNSRIPINIEVGFIAIKGLVLCFILDRTFKIPPVDKFGYMNIAGMIAQVFIKTGEKILIQAPILQSGQEFPTACAQNITAVINA